MEGFIPQVEAIFDERAKDPVLLVDAVEEGANVTLPAEDAPGKLHGTVVGDHGSAPFRNAPRLAGPMIASSGSSRSRDDPERHRHLILDLDEPARGRRRLDPEVGLLDDQLAGPRQRVAAQLDLERYDDRAHGPVQRQIACDGELVRARGELLARDLSRTEAD